MCSEVSWIIIAFQLDLRMKRLPESLSPRMRLDGGADTIERCMRRQPNVDLVLRPRCELPGKSCDKPGEVRELRWRVPRDASAGKHDEAAILRSLDEVTWNGGASFDESEVSHDTPVLACPI